MKLKVLIPTKVFLEATVRQVNAEGKNGAFGLLPNHLDLVTALAPSILSYYTPEGDEIFIAIDEGILVKCGQEILVSTIQAVKDADLETLHRTVEKEFRRLNEQEKITRSAVAKLEAGIARGIVQIGETHRET